MPSRGPPRCTRTRPAPVAVFDRARNALELIDSTPLLDSALRADVARWLDRYGIAVA